MTDLTQVIRWNAGFMRGLAESVLHRAKTIRNSLNPYASAATPVSAKPKKTSKRTITKKNTPKKSAGSRAAKARSPKKAPALKQ